MINVALVSHSGFLCGAETMLYNLARGLRESKVYRPIIFIPEHSGTELETKCIENNIIVVKMPLYPHYIFMTQQSKMFKSRESLTAINFLEKKFLDLDIQLVLSNTLVSVVSQLAAYRCQLPVVTWVHGILDPISGRGLIEGVSYNKQFFYDRIALTLSDRQVFCSKWTQRYFQNYIDSDGMVINNWTETTNVQKPNGQKFICLNTFDQFKGVMTLIEAAALLIEKGFEFELDLYGDGSPDMKSKLQALIETKKLVKTVRLMGRTSDTSKAYTGAICLVQPSFMESFGMTVIEAMAHSRAVISAKSGGPESIIKDGQNGFLVEKNNALELSLAMEKILSDKVLAVKMGKKGHALFKEKYTPEHGVRRFEQLFSKLIKTRKYHEKKERLVYESIMEILELEACVTTETTTIGGVDEVVKSNKVNQGVIETTFHKVPIPTGIFFSRLIENDREFYITTNAKSISKVGVLFASFGKVEGSVKLDFVVHGRVLRSEVKSLSELIMNEWTYFSFETIYGVNDKVLELHFSFNYMEHSDRVGVFLNSSNYDFNSKLRNKFNMKYKTLNLLCVDISS